MSTKSKRQKSGSNRGAVQGPSVSDPVHEAVLRLDLEGRVTQFNSASLKILNCGPEKLLGAKLFEGAWTAYRPDGSPLPWIERPDLKAISTSEPQLRHVLGFSFQEGPLIWVEFNALPIVDLKSRSVTRLAVSFTDVTAWKNERDKHHEIANFKSWIIDGADYIIFATDEKGIITLFNSAAERALGFSSDEMVGKVSSVSVHDFFEVIDRTNQINENQSLNLEPGFETFKTQLDIHGKSEGEWTLVTKDGRRIPAFLSMTKLQSKAKGHSGYLTIARDISEEVTLRSRVNEQNAALIQASKMVSLAEMAAGVAHEINNPLAVLYGKIARATRLAMEPDIPREEILADLAKMKATAERIASIVRAMQSFSRTQVDAGPFEEIAVSELFKESLILCEQLFRLNGVSLEVISLDTLVKVRASQISQVIWSLLSNALDAVKGLPERWVKLEAELRDECVVISVTDSGEGIPETVAGKLMQPFFTTKEVGKGAGLGLSVAKGLVEDHGGQLRLVREREQTCFEFTLPIATAARKSA